MIKKPGLARAIVSRLGAPGAMGTNLTKCVQIRCEGANGIGLNATELGRGAK